MLNSKIRTNLIAALLGLAVFSLSPAASADSGPFIGASVGAASVSADFGGAGNGNKFDEGDFAWKVYGGFAFDLPIVDLGVELGYFDLGAPNGNVLGDNVEISVSGYSAFALAGMNLGPVGVFLKAGIASWDADLVIDDLRGGEDGSDPAFGLGLRFTLGSLEVRGEYEFLDIKNTDDVYMATAGVVWRF